MDKINIKTVNYQDELESIKMIRSLVFQKEQGVAPDLEFDGHDETCHHLLAYLNHQAVGTIRIRYLDQKTVKIERLAVLAQARRKGIGTQLMKKALEILGTQKTYQKIIIHAQLYLQSMYEKLGFQPLGHPFQEAGIWHIKMAIYRD